MNICVLMKYWPYFGGVETVIRFLLNEFTNRGYNTFVVYFIDSNTENSSIMQKTKIYKLPNETETEYLHDFLLKQNINILINNWDDLLYFSKQACKGSSVKLVHCLHWAFYYSQPPKNIIKKKICRVFPVLYERLKEQKYIYKQNKIYNQVDAYILLSENYVEQYKRLAPNKNLEHLFAIPNPLPYTIIKPVDINKKEKKMLFVGRIEEWQKRISMIIECWKNICNKYPDWTLIIVGEGPDMRRTKKLAENLPRIQFEGFREPREYYEKSSIFLMTSSVEGLPMTILECSQFACVPVVMDSFLSVRDIVIDNETGFIVPNDNLRVFTEKVCSLMDNQELREKMGKNGIEFVKKFSTEKIVDKWEKLFEELFK